LAAVLLLCAVGAAPARPLAPEDIRLDVSPAAEVLALWPRDPRVTQLPRYATAVNRRAALRLATSAPYRTLRAFQGEQTRCFMSDEDVQRALLYPESLVCGISLDPAFRDRAALDSLLTEIAMREGPLRKVIAAQAGRYLPDRVVWKPVRLWVLLSSRWSFDAVTMSEAGHGEPVVIVNATEVLGYAGNARERVDVLAHVLAHESFHVGVRQMEGALPGWTGYGPRTRSAFAYVARSMLDEGVAHYVDWRSREGSDTLFTARPGPRERHAFSQLLLAAKRLRERGGDPGARTEILQLASTGPLWSKYGAISGMFAAWRIESRLGADSLRAAVVRGPADFLRMYGGLAAADTSLGRLPEEFAGGK
jgi:hypothetical protein